MPHAGVQSQRDLSLVRDKTKVGGGAPTFMQQFPRSPPPTAIYCCYNVGRPHDGQIKHIMALIKAAEAKRY